MYTIQAMSFLSCNKTNITNKGRDISEAAYMD